MIKEAQLEDIPALLEMGKRFHESSGVPIPYDFDSTEKTFTHLIESGSGFLLMSDGGMIGVLIFPVYFNHAHLSGQELFWWVDKDKRGGGAELLTEAENKAKEMGAITFSMIHLSTSMPERLKAFYQKRGYRLSESHYMKVL